MEPAAAEALAIMFQTQVDAILHTYESLAERVTLMEAAGTLGTKYVMNLPTGGVHRVACYDPQVNFSLWRAACSWKFGGRPYRFVKDIDEGSFICDVCFPSSKKSRPAADSDSSSAASSSSGSE